MERAEIIRILTEKGYPQFMIEKTADKIEALSPEIAVAFENYCLNGIIPENEVEGYSYNKFVTEFGMKPIGALLALDWLVREPEKAKEALLKGIK